MKIGIIFAMKEELEAFLKDVNVLNKYSIFDLTFYKTILFDLDLILVECGVGKVNASRTTQILIDNMDVDYIINIGVAGGIDEKLNVLDIVIASSLVQHDFDITAFDHEKGYIPNVGTFIKSDDYLVNIAKNVSSNLTINTSVGVIASGDIFCTDLKMSKKIHDKFNALCVEMEGASIAQVCFLSHIPFLVLRCISDIPGKNNTLTYEQFLGKSSVLIANYLKKILSKIEIIS